MTTLKNKIAICLATARAQGYTGPDASFELTKYDCDAIVAALGRYPTREEWAEAGYHYVGLFNAVPTPFNHSSGGE